MIKFINHRKDTPEIFFEQKEGCFDKFDAIPSLRDIQALCPQIKDWSSTYQQCKPLTCSLDEFETFFKNQIDSITDKSKDYALFILRAYYMVNRNTKEITPVTLFFNVTLIDKSYLEKDNDLFKMAYNKKNDCYDFILKKASYDTTTDLSGMMSYIHQLGVNMPEVKLRLGAMVEKESI